MTPLDVVLAHETARQLWVAMHRVLTIRERRVLQARVDGLTYQEIGMQHGMSDTRARLIEAKAGSKLRKVMLAPDPLLAAIERGRYNGRRRVRGGW